MSGFFHETASAGPYLPSGSHFVSTNACTEPLLQRALQIGMQACNTEHPLVAEILHQLARFHQVQQQATEALSYQQELTMRERTLGLHHPKTNATRIAYTNLLRELGLVEEVMALESLVLESAIEA